MARYLALDIIRPGDIILSAERSITSIGIRFATFSRVSHAALALHPLIWFEAVGVTGVGYRVVTPEIVWDGEKVRLALKIGRGETYILKRPKATSYRTDDPVTRHTFARSLIEATSAFSFLNYATPDKFLPMLKLRLGRTRFVRFLANNLSRRSTLFPGPFCSWLVVDCYNDVGLQLFDDASDKITPGALERSGNLQQIKSEITATPLDLAPHFKSFERQLRLAVALTNEVLSSLSHGALLPKVVAEINAHITALGKRGADLFGTKAFEEAADALGEIDERSKRDFDDWQNLTRTGLDTAYPMVACSSDHTEFLTFCKDECRDKPYAGMPCPELWGCHKLTKAALQYHEAVYRVFPRPQQPNPDDWQ